MLVTALAIVQRPTVGAAGVLATHFHLSPLVFAVSLAFCAAVILLKPKSAAFMALTLPFVLYIVAAIIYYSAPDRPNTPPILFVALYLTILRLALPAQAEE